MSQPHSAAGVTQYVTPRSETRKAKRTPDETVKDAVIASHEESAQTPSESPRPIPTMGVQAKWYQLVKAFAPNAQPPKLSKKEQTFLSEQALLREREQRAIDSIAYERQLANECTDLVVVFVGVKGAAATTTTMVNTASILADDTRTLVYGADFNPASGTAGARLGKDFGETVSIQEFAAIVDEVKGNRRLVNKKLRPTRYGVRVVSADNYTKLLGTQNGEITARMLEVLEENCDYLLLDSPNDIETPAAQALLAAADVIVFTMNIGIRDSLRLLRVSMDKARELGFGTKVSNSVVVASNAPEGALLGDYEKYLGKTNIHHEVTARLLPGEFQGQMLMVPHDPFISLDGEVDLGALKWETVQAYRDIIIATFEQALAGQSRDNINVLERN